MKNKLKDTVVTKGQLKFIIATDIFIFLTIGMIVYEMKKYGKYNISFFMISIIFLLMAFNQHIYVKNNPGVFRYKLTRIIYVAFGIIILLLAIFNLIG